MVRAPGQALAFGVLTGAFLVSRSIFLDRDLPSWAVAQLQPIDEMYYTISAFDLYRYGSTAHRVVEYVPTDAEPTSMLENAMTAITLALFGNNYYGLRMASVLAGLGSFVILYVLLRRHCHLETSPQGGLAAVLPLLLLVYLVTDFAFDMAARVAEPTIFQLLALVLVLFVASSWRNRQPSIARAFLLGGIAAASWLFVYIFNAFVVGGILLFLVVQARSGGFRRIASQLLAGLAGCATAAGAFALIVYLGYQQTVIQMYQMDIHGRGGEILSGSGIGTNATIAALYVRALDISATNIFRFDMPVLLSFELALPVFLYRMIKERDSFAFLIALLIALLLLQFFIAPDWVQRKLVILSPLIVLAVGMSIPYLGRFITAVGSSRVGQAVVLLWMAGAELWFVTVLRATRASLDFGMETLSLVCVALLIGILLAAFVVGGRFSRELAIIGCASVVLPGLFFSAEHLWINPSYRYRDAMAASAPYLDGRVTAGGYSYMFRLYNSSVPVLDPNLYQYGDLPDYWRYLYRLFGDGTAQCVVTNADAPYQFISDLGLTQVVKFEIDAEDTPVMGLYCRSG